MDEWPFAFGKEVFALRKGIQPVEIEFVLLLLFCPKKASLASDRIDPKNARSKAFNPRKKSRERARPPYWRTTSLTFYPPDSYLS